MRHVAEIIGLPFSIEPAVSRYLLDWEQHHLNAAVADLFGYHALQVGLPCLRSLECNRMPHRWLAVDNVDPNHPSSFANVTTAARSEPLATNGAVGQSPPVSIVCQPEALPFDAASLDLVVLPHTLEQAQNPRQVLREVERVLVPEGRVIVVGFHPASLWGLRIRIARARNALRSAADPARLPVDPAEGILGYRRLKDWLELLSFEVENGRFGCYRPPVGSAALIDRFAWMDGAGERWWPVFGGVYFVVAVKRVRGMRLVGLAQRGARQKTGSAAIAVNHGAAPSEPKSF